MRLRRLLWILGALAGVVLAAGVTYAASSLSTQQVGLSAEPPSAGADLAPAATAPPTPRPRATRTPRPKRTPTPRPRATSTPAPVITAVPTVDDHGGESGDDSSGRGRGRGRGGDDD
jgi:hypothetical protein